MRPTLLARASHIPNTATSHPSDPIPQEPEATRQVSMDASQISQSPPTSTTDNTFSDDGSSIETDPSSPRTDPQSDASIDDLPGKAIPIRGKKRRASTLLVSQNSDDVRRLLGDDGPGTGLIQKACCGGGCCMLQQLKPQDTTVGRVPIQVPDNVAYRSLNIRLAHLGLESELSGLAEIPTKTVSFESVGSQSEPKTYASPQRTTAESSKHPPNFVTPHPPYDVFSAPLYHAREPHQEWS